MALFDLIDGYIVLKRVESPHGCIKCGGFNFYEIDNNQMRCLDCGSKYNRTPTIKRQKGAK